MNVSKIALIVGIASLAAILMAEALSPAALLKDADKHNAKVVEVKGKVEDFEQRTSKKGNKYFLLKLKEGESVVNVYGQGELKPAVDKGDKVLVRGYFRKEKKLPNFTVKNEVDVTPPTGKPQEKGKEYGVFKQK